MFSLNLRALKRILPVAALAAPSFVWNAPGQQPQSGSNPTHEALADALPKEIASKSNPLTEAKINLGRILFYDPRLSKANDVSCNSCHNLQEYGVDGKRVSSGHQGQTGSRNSPTVYNSAGQFAQFWDGRAADIEAQAKGPILNPIEMAMASPEEVVAKVRTIKGYEPLFKAAFPESKDPVSFDNLALAIGAFERKLVTPSRWDRFMAGEESVITAEEKAGHEEFVKSGCPACHNGVYIGGASFQQLGARHAWPTETDLGRLQVTKNDTDRLRFKVPSLRNVEKTAPYFHDGSQATLEDAVRSMGFYQLDKKLDERQVKQIVAWLKTLTGEIPSEYIKIPELPK
ncbi:MAG: Cytochrome-c peroxidase [Bryobacterales bacterium]|nr:Cytochrome-c peroxidase [Bryobacterales bacterium]